MTDSLSEYCLNCETQANTIEELRAANERWVIAFNQAEERANSRIEALTAEVERLLVSNEQWQVDYNEAVIDKLELETENERLRLFVQYTADCCEDAHIVTKYRAALEKQP